VDPSAGVQVDAKISEGRNHCGRVEVVKEAGNVEEEYTSDIPASNGHLCFVAKERGCVGCGMVFPRPKLHAADEVEVVFICSKAVSDDFLEKFTCTFEKGDGVVSFGKGVVWFVGLGDDNHISLAPWVCPVFEGAIECGDDKAGIHLKRPFKELVC
jgi:hypothetical protein